ncbi:binding-protein-dependent transport systems inner membrane component [Mycolicibacterium thermoresistibile ATCC 19527]|uniref:Binding-protein-dependent transport systems inner membrane component n=3 Tax=Mycolicibacterium thermoresistibile TaxID=1797 RepID=G7CLX0_MYCT3|nr:binding-protein-dependent transport systems inner membrane component [Mycolicibacterium thermoresistibile ATCC 19527]GAT13394.1 ABC-type Fe3+ transporter, permease [Mycolicibacterium thermoresistibile]SNW18431.1 binding-protein-dependent transport systems inner membrane component [Mycolicibacterium thermoresistibile]
MLLAARPRRRTPILLLMPAAAVVTATLLPLVYLVQRALERGWAFVLHELAQPRTAALIGRSLLLVVVVTAACVVLGVGFAVLVNRTDLVARRVLAVALTLPLAIPSYLLAFLWVSLVPTISGFWGSTLVLVLVSYPLVMLTTMAALSRVDPAQEEVARSLGLGGWRVLFRVTLRQSRAAITAGALLVALYVLSDFGAVAAMRYEAFTWVIYGAYRSGFNPSRAAVLALVLLVFAVVLVLAEARARGRAAASRVGGGTPRPAPVNRLGRWQPVAWVPPVVVLGAALVAPAVELGHWLVAVGSRWDSAELLSALGSTVWLSVAAAVACTVAALPLGVLAARYRSRLTRVLEGATYLAHGLPAVVVGIAMVSVGVLLLRPLYQQAPLLILAYVVLMVPLAIGSVRSAVEAAPIRLEEVARSLGRPPLRAFVSTTARGAAPGIAAGAALVMLTCMKELPVTLLLHPTGTNTLATRLWGYSSVSDYAAAAPYAAALVVFAAVPTAVLGIWTANIGRGRSD